MEIALVAVGTKGGREGGTNSDQLEEVVIPLGAAAWRGRRRDFQVGKGGWWAWGGERSTPCRSDAVGRELVVSRDRK